MSTELQAQAALAASGVGPPVTARIPGIGAFVARGPDAGSFLHGQLAADIQGVGVGRCNRSLLLNHRGHAIAEAVVLRDAQEWLVVVEDGAADWVGKTLAEHIIFDDVVLSRVPEAATVTVQGSGALEVVVAAVPAAFSQDPAARGADASGPGAACWRGRHRPTGLDLSVYPRTRSGAGGYDLTLLDVDHDAVAAGVQVLHDELVAAGAVSVSAAAIDAARVAAGITTAGRDGGAGILPQEAGLTGGLSYRKGCYLGQEVMARIEARGNLKRGLATVEIVASAAAVEPVLAHDMSVTNGGEADTGGAKRHDIELEGRKVGVLGTAAVMPDGRVMALAVLRRDLATEGGLTAAGLQLRVLEQVPA